MKILKPVILFLSLFALVFFAGVYFTEANLESHDITIERAWYLFIGLLLGLCGLLIRRRAKKERKRRADIKILKNI